METKKKKAIGYFMNSNYLVLSRSDRRGRLIYWHKAVAENKIGRPLQKGEVVHHADNNKLNNDPGNLQVCPSRKAHNARHVITEAYLVAGNPFFRKCHHCGKHGDPAEMKIHRRRNVNNGFEHYQCANDYKRKWQATSPTYQKYRMARRQLRITLKTFNVKGKGAQSSFGF